MMRSPKSSLLLLMMRSSVAPNLCIPSTPFLQLEEGSQARGTEPGFDVLKLVDKSRRKSRTDGQAVSFPGHPKSQGLELSNKVLSLSACW